MKYSFVGRLISAIALSCGLLLSSHVAADALAQPGGQSKAFQTQSITIAYSNAELSTAEGREAVYNKIRRAAKQVCGPVNPRDAGGLQLASRNRSCYEDTMAMAVSQIENEQLAALMP